MKRAKGEQVFTDDTLAGKIIGHTELNSRNTPPHQKQAPCARPEKKHCAPAMIIALAASFLFLLIFAGFLKRLKSRKQAAPTR